MSIQVPPVVWSQPFQGYRLSKLSLTDKLKHRCFHVLTICCNEYLTARFSYFLLLDWSSGAGTLFLRLSEPANVHSPQSQSMLLLVWLLFLQWRHQFDWWRYAERLPQVASVRARCLILNDCITGTPIKSVTCPENKTSHAVCIFIIVSLENIKRLEPYKTINNKFLSYKLEWNFAHVTVKWRHP